MSEESNPAEERLERLARDFLGEYQQDDALAALAEIAKVVVAIDRRQPEYRDQQYFADGGDAWRER